MKKDLYRIRHHYNNTKRMRMTDAQWEQHKADTAAHYAKKWETLKAGAETEAQKNYCDEVLRLVNFMF